MDTLAQDPSKLFLTLQDHQIPHAFLPQLHCGGKPGRAASDNCYIHLSHAISLTFPVNIYESFFEYRT